MITSCFLCLRIFSVRSFLLKCYAVWMSFILIKWTSAYSISTTDPATKGVALCRAKKQAHQQAVQNAFHRILLVILDNGKVYVDINSSVEDRVYCDEQLTLDNLLEVCLNYEQTLCLLWSMNQCLIMLNSFEYYIII